MAADETVAGKDQPAAAEAPRTADEAAATADEKAPAGKKDAATGKKEAATTKDQPKPAVYCTLLCCDKLLTDLNVTDEQRTEIDKLQKRLKGTILGGGVKSLHTGRRRARPARWPEWPKPGWRISARRPRTCSPPSRIGS